MLFLVPNALTKWWPPLALPSLCESRLAKLVRSHRSNDHSSAFGPSLFGFSCGLKATAPLLQWLYQRQISAPNAHSRAFNCSPASPLPARYSKRLRLSGVMCGDSARMSVSTTTLLNIVVWRLSGYVGERFAGMARECVRGLLCSHSRLCIASRQSLVEVSAAYCARRHVGGVVLGTSALRIAVLLVR